MGAQRAVVGASPYNYFTNYDAIICKRGRFILSKFIGVDLTFSFGADIVTTENVPPRGFDPTTAIHLAEGGTFSVFLPNYVSPNKTCQLVSMFSARGLLP